MKRNLRRIIWISKIWATVDGVLGDCCAKCWRRQTLSSSDQNVAAEGFDLRPLRGQRGGAVRKAWESVRAVDRRVPTKIAWAGGPTPGVAPSTPRGSAPAVARVLVRRANLESNITDGVRIVQPQRGRVRLASATQSRSRRPWPESDWAGSWQRVAQGDFDRAVGSRAGVRQSTVTAVAPDRVLGSPHIVVASS